MLTVETGSGVVGADSYASMAQADAVLTRSTAWQAATTDDKEAALRDGAFYLDTFELSNEPATLSQGLAYPWANPTYTAFALSRIARANIMLADIALLGPLVGGKAQEGRIVSQSKTLGPLSKSTTYADEAPASIYGRDLSFIDALLSSVTGSGNGLVIGTSARA